MKSIKIVMISFVVIFLMLVSTNMQHDQCHQDQVKCIDELYINLWLVAHTALHLGLGAVRNRVT